LRGAFRRLNLWRPGHRWKARGELCYMQPQAFAFACFTSLCARICARASRPPVKSCQNAYSLGVVIATSSSRRGAPPNAAQIGEMGGQVARRHTQTNPPPSPHLTITRPRRVQPRPQNVPWSAIEGGAAHIGSTALVSRAAGSGRAHRMARPAPHHKGGALDTRGKIYSLPTKEPR